MCEQMHLKVHQDNADTYKKHLKHKNVWYCNCGEDQSLEHRHKIIGVTCTLERPVLECPTENYVAHTEVVVRYQEWFQ